MTKFSLSYLAGALSVGIAIYLDGGRGSLIAFGLGVLTVVSIAVALLASTTRLRRAARVLNAFAAGLDARAPRELAIVEPKPAKAAKPEPEPIDDSTVEGQVATALINFKVPEKRALEIARRAVAQLPGGDFQSTFRIALQRAKAAA